MKRLLIAASLVLLATPAIGHAKDKSKNSAACRKTWIKSKKKRRTCDQENVEGHPDTASSSVKEKKNTANPATKSAPAPQ